MLFIPIVSLYSFLLDGYTFCVYKTNYIGL